LLRKFPTLGLRLLLLFFNDQENTQLVSQ
jgi:hypothetical protein